LFIGSEKVDSSVYDASNDFADFADCHHGLPPTTQLAVLVEILGELR